MKNVAYQRWKLIAQSFYEKNSINLPLNLQQKVLSTVLDSEMCP